MRDWLRARADRHCRRRGRGAARRARPRISRRQLLHLDQPSRPQHPKINSAIQRQLKKIAHSSALGLANEPASFAGAKSWSRAGPRSERSTRESVNPKLEKVFFSDDGSTALEVALKLAYEFTRRTAAGQLPREEISSRDSFPLKARITATPSARSRSATLICFTRLMPACFSRPTKSCRRIATAVRSTAPSRSAPTRGNTGNAIGNVSARWSKNFPRRRKREILTPLLFSSR